MFRRWLRQIDPQQTMLGDFVNALLAGNSKAAEAFLQDILLRIVSFQDGAGKEPEKLYHGLVLGMLVHLESQYEIRSNREAGHGRADVLMRPKNPGHPGVVMEFKVPFGKETPEQALEKAAKQVRDRKYAADVAAAGASPVYEYAMVFDGKQAWVKRVEELLG